MASQSLRVAHLRGPGLAVLLAGGALALLALAGHLAARRDPLRRAWSAAQAAGSYAVAGTTRARTADGTAAYAVEGTGTAAGLLTITVRAADGAEDAGVAVDTDTDSDRETDADTDSDTDVAAADVVDGDRATGVTYAVAWPRVTALGAAAPPIDPHALALVFPAGDPLALLATAHGPSPGPLEWIDGRDCRRVDFLVGAPAYAAWWLGHQAWLPVNADAGGLHKFTGTGTLWLDPGTDRPCRIAARVDLPRLAGEQAGSGEADWVYRDWGDVLR